MNSNYNTRQSEENRFLVQSRLGWVLPLMGVLLVVIHGLVIAVVELVVVRDKQLFDELGGPEEEETSVEEESWDVTNSDPFALMSNQQVRVYAGFVIATTLILSGFGLEAFVFCYCSKQWNETRDMLWRVAQHNFSLLVLMAFGLSYHHNFFALAVGVVGIFKFGFPETISYMYLALFDKGASATQRSADFMNSVGLAVHHSAFLLAMGMLLADAFPISRYLIIACFIPIMQHWAVLLKYFSKKSYVAFELILEFWFEWVVVSQFQYFRSIGWVVSWLPASMMFSHWLFLLAAGTEMLGSGVNTFQDNIFVRVLNINHGETRAFGGKSDTPAISEVEDDDSLCDC